MDTSDGPSASTRSPSSRPASQKSARSSRSRRSRASSHTTEQTPLLARDAGSDDEEEGADREGAQTQTQTPATTSLLRSLIGSRDGSASIWKKRWPSILALVILCIVVVFIMLGFLAAEGVEEYAMQAADFRPTKMALDSLTTTGATVHVEGDFTMDASKVQKKSVRNFGRLGTWIAREVESGPTDVKVYLPEYGDVLLGTASFPSLKVNVRNGHTTHLSFKANLEPGSLDGIRSLAHDWIDGRLGHIRVKGKADVSLKSGLISIGSKTVEQMLVIQGKHLPELPAYNITKINLREAEHGNKGMGADISVTVTNDFPVQLQVPAVAVDVLVDGCQPSDQHIMVGTAETTKLNIEPETDLHVNVTGHVGSLPDSLVEVCPDSAKSPLDSLLGDYMHGQAATIYVKCCNFPDPETPGWAQDLLNDITVPVPFAGRDMGNLIKNFSLADVHFSLPDFWAEPGTPEASPRISAVIKVDIGLPREMNFPLDVDGVKANADVFYHKKKLGELNLDKWQKANSTRIEAHGDDGPSLLVQSSIKDAPLDITDDDVFSEVIQALIGGNKPVLLDIKAAVSVKVDTPLGGFAVREIPAKGVVPVKPIGGGKGDDKIGKGFKDANVHVGNLSIVDTSPTSMTLQVRVNFTNPTNYSATVPYFSINILVNDTVLAQATVEDLVVHPGNNTNVAVKAKWDPFTNSGEKGKQIGSELLSQYISGFNTSVTIQTHKGTIPALPSIGLALSKLPLTFPAPHLSTPSDPSSPSDPDDGDDDGDASRPHFIRNAIMHLLSSTAIFTLASPFTSTTMFLTSLNATAYYDGHPAGVILYDQPFAVPPGLSESPRLPVDWNLGSVGFGAVKKALGGTLKLSAFAHVGIRIGQWKEQIWFQGGKIGAKVRI